MKAIIDKPILEKYPDLRIGVIVGRGINNSSSRGDLQLRKQTEAEDFRSRCSMEDLSSHPNIIAWRETYRSFGAKPKKYRPTAEALLRRILKGEEIPTINMAVDAYLLAELHCMLPVGGYDLDTISGNIVLRISSGGEPFTPLGYSTPEEETKEGEIVYADSERVLTRRWNYRDADPTKITAQSRNIILMTEGAFAQVPTEDVKRSAEMIAANLREFCGGTICTGYMDHSISELELEQLNCES